MKLRFFLLALLMTAGASAADVYKWVDADGTVHYSDAEPAAEIKAQRVHLIGSVSTTTEATVAASDDDGVDDETRKAAQGRKMAEIAAGGPQRRCDQARQDLELLQSNAAVALNTSDHAKTEVLTDAQRQEQIAHTQMIIANNCK